MKVKSVLALCSSCYVEILSSDDKKCFETYAFVDYFTNVQHGLYYPARCKVPEHVQNMKVDFFTPSRIIGADDRCHDGVRIYVK